MERMVQMAPVQMEPEQNSLPSLPLLFGGKTLPPSRRVELNPCNRLRSPLQDSDSPRQTLQCSNTHIDLSQNLYFA